MSAVKRVLSLGAGVQSTTVLLLAAEGRLPKLDAAIFADTGWEPRAVYNHLDRLEREVAQPAGIPILRVSNGNLRDLTVDPTSDRFTNLPLYLRGSDGSDGMGRRSCTADHKVAPIKRQVRELLGYPHPHPVPAGMYVEQWIGISLDEVHRAKDSDVKYMQHAFPLLDLKWTRKDCVRYLTTRGWGETPKSACIGCPFHGNAAWRQLRDEHPDEWADAVDFDARLRTTEVREHLKLNGLPFLHRSRQPLSEAPIDRVTRHEWNGRQVDLLDLVADEEAEEPPGCSPFACERGDDAA